MIFASTDDNEHLKICAMCCQDVYFDERVSDPNAPCYYSMDGPAVYKSKQSDNRQQVKS